MPIRYSIENGGFVFRVPLDDATVARLMTVADMCHDDPANIIASIIHDVLKDDEDAHLLETMMTSPQPTNH